MLEDIFTQGHLEMSTAPVPQAAAGVMWGDVLTNRILALAAVVLLLVELMDFFSLFPHLVYSLSRPRGSAGIESSVSVSRLRNNAALVMLLPFCLICDRFALYRPSFWSLIPDYLSVAATLGVVLVFMLLRRIFFAFLRTSRPGSSEKAAAFSIPYNYFILVTIVMLISVGISALTGADDLLTSKVLLIELAVALVLAMGRQGHFLSGYCDGFTTILYLCTLEILPAAILVASAVFL